MILHLNSNIVPTTLPTHTLSFKVLDQQIKEFLIKHDFVKDYYKIRDNGESKLYIYLPKNQRLEVYYNK